MPVRFRKPVKTSIAPHPNYSAGLARHFGLHNTGDDTSHLRSVHDNSEALAWRLALIEQAEHTIDAQYYSWHLDTTGLLLIDRLLDAADRGVRVRLLIDDIHIFGIDRQIATLNRHRNIEVRLFNPFTFRSRFRVIRLLELLFKLDRLNHRMHNKLLVADNLLGIVGGRNIGDEYFGMHDSLNFSDLDLLIAGHCIPQLSASFDDYWNHKLSHTVHKLIALRPRVLDLKHLRQKTKTHLRSKHSELLRIEQHKQHLLATNHKPSLSTLLPIAAKVDVLYDPPGFDSNSIKKSLDTLYQCSLLTHDQLIIVSAYFIPDEVVLEAMQQLTNKNVRVQVYTNSLASIDVTVAFSGYQRYRHRLLSMGVELFEHCANITAVDNKHNALHAKCIVFDSSRVYVGTLNLDPRSAHLNTEIGLLIESPQLAIDLHETILQQQQGDYWQLSLDTNERLHWQRDTTRLMRQPSRGLWQCFTNWLFALLPIKRHL